jgi:hypothetical protein
MVKVSVLQCAVRGSVCGVCPSLLCALRNLRHLSFVQTYRARSKSVLVGFEIGVLMKCKSNASSVSLEHSDGFLNVKKLPRIG